MLLKTLYEWAERDLIATTENIRNVFWKSNIKQAFSMWLSDYLDLKDPLGGHGDRYTVVRIHEWCSAIWTASSSWSTGWTSPRNPDPGGAGGSVAWSNRQGSCAGNIIIQTNVAVHKQGCAQWSVNNKCCPSLGLASECFAEGHNILDKCHFNNQV